MKISDIIDTPTINEAIEPALVVDPEKEMDRKEIYSLLNRYKETLGPETSEMLDLWADGKSYADISRIVGKTQEAVRLNVMKGLSRLKRQLNIATSDDAGHLYGYKRKRSTDQYHSRYGMNMSLPHLYRMIKDHDAFKIIKVGAGFTIVPRDEPGDEVIYDPNHKANIHKMEGDLKALKDAIRRLETAAFMADGGQFRPDYINPRNTENRRQLYAEPAFQNARKSVEKLERDIAEKKKRGTWYVQATNESEKPWDQKNPRKTHKKLSASDKAAARARASRHGRKYPNWIDNAWASKR